MKRRSMILCIPALITVTTLTVSCATAPRRPTAVPVPTEAERTAALQHATEDAVASYIYTQLDEDPIYFFRHVNVRVDEGVATLSGYVWETDAIYRAREIAGDVPGVTRVVSNDLRLERNGQNSGPAR